MSSLRAELLASLSDHAEALGREAFQIADQAAVTEIQTNAVPINLAGQRWYDLRRMTDSAEHPPEVLALHAQHITYAAERGLVIHSISAPHLVRLAA